MSTNPSSTDDCLFCAIARGDTPATVVYEDDAFVAFLDHRPLFHGHVLVVPRKHHRNMFELPPDQTGPLFELVQRMSLAVRDAMEADGIFMASNNGVSQSVDHVHIHVIPRRKKDGLRGFMWPRTRYIDGEADEVSQRIRAKL